MRVVSSPPARPVLLRSALALVASVAAIGALPAPAGASTPALASPEPPANVVVDPSAPSRATEVRVTWTRPASAAPDADVRWSLCPAPDPLPPAAVDDPYPDGLDAPGCTSGVAEAPTAAIVPTPAEGRFLLRLRFVAEGMADGPVGSPAEPVVIDRTAPGRPTVKYDGTTVRWTAPDGQVAPVVRAHWRLCRGWASPTPWSCVEGASESTAFPFDDRQVPLGPPPGYCPGSGEWTRVWLEDAAGNADEVNAGGFGYSVIPDCVAPPGPQPPPIPAVARVATRMALSARTRSLSRGRHAVTLTASLAPKAAAGRVRLTVKGEAFSRTRTATVRGGRATTTIVVPRAVRRLSVRGAYAATASHAASAARLAVRLPRP